jgi:GNAT superfamily N-acetyltransferase
MSIRRLDTADHDVARPIRLRALWDSPAAYGSTYEREVRFPSRIWVDRLAVKTNATFLLESPEYGASGIVAVVRDDTDQRLAHLVGMWVDPRIRGTGAADDLVDRVILWAQTTMCRLCACTSQKDNGRAERLYLRHGFARTGGTFSRERDGATEVEMERAMETG